MPILWPDLLFRLISVGVTTAAGTAASAAATAFTANPILGASADAVARQAAEQLLKQFLPAQQEAMQKIELAAREIQSLVGDIDTRVRSLQQGPWRAARLHMEDAAVHPERAVEELEAARGLLYEAWGAATDPAQRSLAAQELSGIFAFLGRRTDSLRWLERALPDNDLAASEAIESFRTSLDQFPDKIPRRSDARDYCELQLQHNRVFAPLDKVLPAVQRLVEARYDALDLRKRSTLIGAGRPWPQAPSRVELCRGGEILFSTPGGGVAASFENHNAGSLSSDVRKMLRAIKTLHFSIADGPWLDRTGRAYVVGAAPQLGEWKPEYGIQLAPRPKSEHTISSTVWTLKRKSMDGVVQVLEDESVEVRYFFVPDQGGPIIWDEWIRVSRAYTPAPFYRPGDMFLPAPALWGIAS